MTVKQLNGIRSFGMLAVWKPILRTQPRARSGRRSIPAYVVSQDRDRAPLSDPDLGPKVTLQEICQIIALLTNMGLSCFRPIEIRWR
jgi:hypothetical protein